MSAARSCSDLVFGIHTPDRSGWPSAAFGAGALRSGLPSAPRGTPGVGVASHCAESGATSIAARINASLTIMTIGPLDARRNRERARNLVTWFIGHLIFTIDHR